MQTPASGSHVPFDLFTRTFSVKVLEITGAGDGCGSVGAGVPGQTGPPLPAEIGIVVVMAESRFGISTFFPMPV
jgi:hypothetical protein